MRSRVRMLCALGCGLAVVLISAAAVHASSLSTTILATPGINGKGIQSDRLVSDYLGLSTDGRILVFAAQSNHLVKGDTNTHTEIFAYDKIAKTTERIKTNKGAQINGDSYTPTVSGDGRYVAFISGATNILTDSIATANCPAVGLCWNVYVYDRLARRSTLANLSTSGMRLDVVWDEAPAAISANGKFVAFQSKSSIASSDTNGDSDILVRDLSARTTRLVSGGSTLPDRWGWEASTFPSISGDGRYVAFSTIRNLTPDDKNSSQDVYVYDQQTNTTTRASKSAYNAQWYSDSLRPRISADGRYVVFESAAVLVWRDTNQRQDIYEYDLHANKTILVSTASNGELADGSSFRPTISGDGRLVAFESDAKNIVRADTNQNSDIFVHYRDFGVTNRVSLGSRDTAQANNSSYYGTISADSKTVVFNSPSTNLTTPLLAGWGYNLFMNYNPVAAIPYYDGNDFLNLFPR